MINNGDHGRVPTVTLTVQWPYEIAASGEYLLYMIKEPQIVDSRQGQAKCEPSYEHVNSLGLKIKVRGKPTV